MEQDRVEKAIGYFKQGYNCSQSVAMAFADLYDIPDGTYRCIVWRWHRQDA